MKVFAAEARKNFQFKLYPQRRIKLGATTLTITTFSITAISIKGLKVTLSINVTA